MTNPNFDCAILIEKGHPPAIGRRVFTSSKAFPISGRNQLSKSTK